MGRGDLSWDEMGRCGVLWRWVVGKGKEGDGDMESGPRERMGSVGCDERDRWEIYIVYFDLGLPGG